MSGNQSRKSPISRSKRSAKAISEPNSPLPMLPNQCCPAKESNFCNFGEETCAWAYELDVFFPPKVANDWDELGQVWYTIGILLMFAGVLGVAMLQAMIYDDTHEHELDRVLYEMRLRENAEQQRLDRMRRQRTKTKVQRWLQYRNAPRGGNKKKGRKMSVTDFFDSVSKRFKERRGSSTPDIVISDGARRRRRKFFDRVRGKDPPQISFDLADEQETPPMHQLLGPQASLRPRLSTDLSMNFNFDVDSRRESIDSEDGEIHPAISSARSLLELPRPKEKDNKASVTEMMTGRQRPKLPRVLSLQSEK